ncbi:hypothetical protein C8R46DRAFT_1042095 [Mycena filopes]|nr:hypothetical protein C8R46DRAFT_1042095 [Mycena filopes]
MQTERIASATWLVIWEAGVAIQLPPWVLALYPSALFYHFNIDIDDTNVSWPTRENCRPVTLGDELGRGSMVFFNQSTMTQAAFTGYPTVQAAKIAGHSGTTDFGDDVQAAFSKHSFNWDHIQDTTRARIIEAAADTLLRPVMFSAGGFRSSCERVRSSRTPRELQSIPKGLDSGTKMVMTVTQAALGSRKEAMKEGARRSGDTVRKRGKRGHHEGERPREERRERFRRRICRLSCPTRGGLAPPSPLPPPTLPRAFNAPTARRQRSLVIRGCKGNGVNGSERKDREDVQVKRAMLRTETCEEGLVWDKMSHCRGMGEKVYHYGEPNVHWRGTLRTCRAVTSCALAWAPELAVVQERGPRYDSTLSVEPNMTVKAGKSAHEDERFAHQQRFIDIAQ